MEFSRLRERLNNWIQRKRNTGSLTFFKLKRKINIWTETINSRLYGKVTLIWAISPANPITARIKKRSLKIVSRVMHNTYKLAQKGILRETGTYNW